MNDKILIELNIDANNKIVIIKKHNSSEIHNDSYILFYALVNNYLLADNSFIDECRIISEMFKGKKERKI